MCRLSLAAFIVAVMIAHPGAAERPVIDGPYADLVSKLNDAQRQQVDQILSDKGLTKGQLE